MWFSGVGVTLQKPTNSYLNQRLEFQYTGGKLYEKLMNTPLHDTEQETPKICVSGFS